MKKIVSEIADQDTEDSNSNLGRVVPISRNEPPSSEAGPKKKDEVSNNFKEIPKYLISITSTLFKRATAEEVFLSRLSQKKINKVNERSTKSIIKTDKNAIENQKKETVIRNLMSESNSIYPIRDGRRRSVEVTPKDTNITFDDCAQFQRSEVRQDPLPGMISSGDYSLPKPSAKPQLSKPLLGPVRCT